MQRLLAFTILWLLGGIASLPDAVASQPQSERAGIAILGSGWADCAEVTDTTASDDNLRFLFASWVQGYITGRNETGAPADGPSTGVSAQGDRVQADALRDIGANVSPASLVTAALDYCEEHPLDKFADASRSVYDQLVRSARTAR